MHFFFLNFFGNFTEVMSNRLASGKGIMELKTPSQSLSTMINNAMVRSENEHVKQWQRYKHYNHLQHSSSRQAKRAQGTTGTNGSRRGYRGGRRTTSPMKMSTLKKHTRIGVLKMSPLGYDGSLPAVKKSKWSLKGPRLTSSSSNAYICKELSRTAVTQPRKHRWNGLRVQNNAVEEEVVVVGGGGAGGSSESGKNLFGSETIPRTWKLPNFDSPW